MSRPSAMTRDAAEALAIEVLGFLAGDPGRLGRFLALTGLGPAQLREAAREPGFLAGILDHIVADERLLLLFADTAGRDPSDVKRAQTVMSGRTWERTDP